MRIGVYGGTFNPPHLGHLAAAKAAAEQLRLDRLLLIPDGTPPHKELPAGSPAPEQRLELLRIAADEARMPVKTSVLDLELRRAGRSFTSDTLTQLRELYPDDQLWLLMGTDMFLTVQDWHESGKLMSLCTLAPFRREQADMDADFARQTAFLQREYGAQVDMVALEQPVEISSTQLRQALAAGECPHCLPVGVYGYILREGLYGVQQDLKKLDYDQLRAVSYSMVKAKRIPHIRGTEEEAVRLAHRWGVDEDEARTAAILHDCTKYLTLDEQLKLCDKYGILLDNLEKQALKLLHSKTGAGTAQALFGVSPRIYDAIFWHTTGKADMNRLEKVIYIADYMEPTRDFDGVERLRQLVYEDLDAAVLLGLEMSVAEMESMGNPVHYRTIEARDWLRKRLK